MGLKAVLEALSKLTNIEPTVAQFAAFKIEVEAEKNDRGAAVLEAATVENSLQWAIIRTFAIPLERQKELFRHDGPLGSFSDKIRIAHALNIFGTATRSNLDIIRTLRNTFAHSMIALSFDTPEIAEACRLLTVPDVQEIEKVYASKIGLMDRSGANGLEGRKRYRWICGATSTLLRMRVIAGAIPVDPAALKVSLEAGYEVWARPSPLP